MIKTAMLLPAGPRVQPEEILIDDYQNIQAQVGGHFDVVRFSGQLEEGKPVVLCGYVHDEGLLLGMELNYLATMLFQQPIVGPCVVTYALSPNGEYDGDDYDMPTELIEFISQDILVATANAYNSAALMGWATERMIAEEILTEEDVELVMDAINSTVMGEATEMPVEAEMIMMMVQEYLNTTEQELQTRVKDAAQEIVNNYMKGENDGSK
jgi:hypothetical protein